MTPTSRHYVVRLIVAAIALGLVVGGAVHPAAALTRAAKLPTDTPISFSPAINTGPDTQRKSGSLLIGPVTASPNTGSLCLNDDAVDTTDDAVNCVSSWDSFASIIGTSVAVTTGRLLLNNALSISAHLGQSGFVDLISQSSQPKTSTVTAPAAGFCNLGTSTCYNDNTKTCVKNSDCGYNGTGLYALGNSYGSAGIFSGTVYVAPSFDPNLGAIANNNICLGFSQSPVCIASWNDLQYKSGIGAKVAYIERFKTNQQPDAASETLDLKSVIGTQGYYDAGAGNGAFLSNHATMGTVDVGNVCAGPLECSTPTNLVYTCGNGVCDNPNNLSNHGELSSGTYKCEIDCSPPSIPAALTYVSSVAATSITLNMQAASQKPDSLCAGGTANGATCNTAATTTTCTGGGGVCNGAFGLLLLESKNSSLSNTVGAWTTLFVPRNGVTYTAGQTFGTCTGGTNPGTNCTNNAAVCVGSGAACATVKVVYSAVVPNISTNYSVTDGSAGAPLGSGTFYYALFQSNLYPIYNLAPLFTNRAI